MTAVLEGIEGEDKELFCLCESKNEKHMILSIRSCSPSIHWNRGFLFRKPSLIPDYAFCHPLNTDNFPKL